MRSVRATSPLIGALAAVLIWGALGPAEAGRVCNELDLRSPCISSSDLRARLNLDEDDTDARLRLRDEDGENALTLNGGNATVTNLFSNEEDESNGLVKAWAQINADGTIRACWRCNTDTSETGRVQAGVYEVDSTPLATDITGRPRSATIDNGVNLINVNAAFIDIVDRINDPSSVLVSTADQTGAASDRPFVLIVY